MGRHSARDIGVVFTPIEIVKLMHEVMFLSKQLTSDNSRAIKEKTFEEYMRKHNGSITYLEPSFGEGVFLIDFVEQLILFYKKYAENNELFTQQKILGIVQKSVWGFEINEVYVCKTHEKINNLIWKYLPRSINRRGDWNLICDNFLLPYENLTERYPLLKHIKFSFVVGNPPYIQNKHFNTEINNFSNGSTFCTGRTDTYLMFFEQGIKFLKEEGCLCFITPQGYLSNVGQKKLRTYLIEKEYLKLLIKCPENTFVNVSTYPVITCLKKSKLLNRQDVYVGALEEDCSQENEMRKIKLRGKFSSLTDTQENEDNWNKRFFGKHDQKNGPVLADYFSVKNSVVTCNDSIFIDFSKDTMKGFDKSTDLFLFKDQHLIEKKSCRKVYHCGKRKYGVVIFPYYECESGIIPYTEAELQKSFPNAYTYLLIHLEELSKFKTNHGKWYLFGKSQGLTTLNRSTEKICISYFLPPSSYKGVRDYCRIIRSEVVVVSGMEITTREEYGNHESLSTLKELLKTDEFLNSQTESCRRIRGGYSNSSVKSIGNFKWVAGRCKCHKY